MNISDTRLREIVQRVIKEIEMGAENFTAVKTGSLYVCCLKEWDDSYVRFLNDMKIPGHLRISPVIPSEWKTNGFQTLLESRSPIKAVTYEEMGNRNFSEEDITVFPVVPPELAAKTALGISDTPEVRWIVSCMEQGSRIVFASSGFRKFTGKEPQAYRDRVMSYYRIILEYGIGILDGTKIFEAPVRKNSTDSSKGQHVSVADQAGRAEAPEVPAVHKRRVITSADVEKYQVDGEIVLYPGDQITDIAKDRAKFLKITLKRA